jgi:hypothetical protein
MNSIAKPRFEMKMTGNVLPQDVPVSLLGEFLIQIEKSVLAVLGESTETGDECALLSLVDVREGSNALELASPATVLPAIGILATAIATQNYEGIPVKAHAHLYEANKLCQRKGWGIEIVGDEKYGIPNASIKPGELIPQPRAPKKAKGTTTIIGQVVKAGGIEPKVHIKTKDNGISLHIAVDENLAKELAGRLYETVALECRVAWNMEDWSYDPKSVRVIRLGSYRKKGRASHAFDELRRIADNRWEGIDPVKYVNDIYAGEIQKTDGGNQ